MEPNPSSKAGSAPGCRFCGAPLETVFADLGMSPLSNAYVAPEQANAMEPFYPLRALACDRCYLVQLEEYTSPDSIFSDYAYFSSYSTSWLEHSRRYVEMAVERFGLHASSQVVELASNDGYLLQYFRDAGIPVLGVEPAANVAAVAEEKGIPTEVAFFGRETAERIATRGKADLLLGNNVLAHVPDLNDFVSGLKALLADDGTLTMEFPHLMRLVDENQYDTIYHEHFSYFSFMTVREVFATHGLRLFDVEELPTHGGSLRIFGCHEGDPRPDEPATRELLERERAAGYGERALYERFARSVQESKRDTLSFLIDLKKQDKTIVGYGAAAKGNTLLNYCGIRTDFIDYTVDRNPHKQGHFLPGSLIPIRPVETISETRPDVVLILPWNLKNEIVEQMSYIRDWGGRFATRDPELTLLP